MSTNPDPEYHNPDELTEWGKSEGWRLLTKEEMKGNLPDDAEFCDDGDKKWWRSDQAGKVCNPADADPVSGTTYRTKQPLPSDPLSYYEHELPAVIRGVRNGEKWVQSGGTIGIGFHQPDDQSLAYLKRCLDLKREVRLAPKPTLRQWTFETRPEGMVWVHRKDDPTREYLVAGWTKGTVAIPGLGWVSYESLFTDWLQRDGKPCGTEEGGSK